LRRLGEVGYGGGVWGGLGQASDPCRIDLADST